MSISRDVNALFRHGSVIAAALAYAVTWPISANAGDLPPWSDPGDLPLPSYAISVSAIGDDVSVHVEPNAESARRGTLAPGVPLPLYTLKRGSSCAGRWALIGPLAWVCQDRLLFRGDDWSGATDLVYRNVADGMPFRYFFVGANGSSGFADIENIDSASPDQDLEAGFSVAITEQRNHRGAAYGRSHHGLWVPMHALAAARPSTFHGQTIDDGKIDFGWVINDAVVMYSKPQAAARLPQKLARFTRVRVRGSNPKFVQIDDGQWVSARDMQIVSPAPRPSEVTSWERWIDVDLATQTLVAYQGDRPVYATLVSTGRGGEFETPPGVHRIWVKLVSSNMDNLEDDDTSRYYSIEDVPFVQYFSGGVGLHGAFWHSQFGHVHSHGCVNLAPIDAQWLFAWTGPRLPAGWTAVHPTDLESGTVVRVRQGAVR